MLEEVEIQKLVHGGQGLGQLLDGRKVFVWNALPGETVRAKITKKRRDYAEGIAEEIVKASDERIEPVDEAYLSTSPWQILKWEAENDYKKEILQETFNRESVELPGFDLISMGEPLNYRNKMEYSFWGDDNGLHLALFHRASHGKRIVQGSSIARPEIDTVANHILAELNKNGVRASSLKTVILRSNRVGEVVAALFVKDENFQHIDFTDICKSVVVYYSNPKSPASVVTKELYKVGRPELTDEIRGSKLTYGVNSFFQVNLPVFETALDEIAQVVAGEKDIVDMYAGVGTIGLSVGAQKLVELDRHNIETARQNVAGKDIGIIHASTEQALEHITSDATVIFDPPRAGLHEKVTKHLLEVKPKRIVYLSCNPSTQARDLARIQSTYDMTLFKGYNFFPRTPHIESLAILQKRV